MSHYSYYVTIWYHNRPTGSDLNHSSKSIIPFFAREKFVWGKQTILVFFATNIVLSGPKKSPITSSEAVGKIEIAHTHSCQRNVPSLLNVPKRPSLTVSLYLPLCLSPTQSHDTRITNHSSSLEWRHSFNIPECLKTMNCPKENQFIRTVRDSN